MFDYDFKMPLTAWVKEVGNIRIPLLPAILLLAVVTGIMVAHVLSMAPVVKAETLPEGLILVEKGKKVFSAEKALTEIGDEILFQYNWDR